VVGSDWEIRKVTFLIDLPDIRVKKGEQVAKKEPLTSKEASGRGKSRFRRSKKHEMVRKE